MWFWWFLFLCNLLYSLTMILCGRWMWKHSPKSVNSLIGYRTKRSMTNSDTWQFAQEYCGKLWWKTGWIMLFPTILVQLPFYGKSYDAIGGLGIAIAIIECTIFILSILPTERALRRTFTEDGRKKEQAENHK